MKRRFQLGAVVALSAAITLSACQRVQDAPITGAVSSDGWHLAVLQRGWPLTVGTNAFVVTLQDQTRAYTLPGDVQVKMTMVPAGSDGTAQAQTVNLQPDGQNGFYLAIVDLPQKTVWRAELTATRQAVDHRFTFSLQN